ncbi:hypothetical protein [Actinoplanes sp. HUAS TT8]|uniref:hypothetical protein n=1 Tax=Actinoplanes sp. HUAS TT8 TaxID=3447453 RepID=UPI003F52174C
MPLIDLDTPTPVAPGRVPRFLIVLPVALIVLGLRGEPIPIGGCDPFIGGAGPVHTQTVVLDADTGEIQQVRPCP